MERHHEPSERKLGWLRGRGVVPVSRTVVAAAVMGAGIIAAGLIAGDFLHAWSRLAARALGVGEHTVPGALSVMRAGLAIVGVVVAAIGLAGVAGWLVSHFLQAGLPGKVPGRPAGDDPGYYSRADMSRADTAARALTSGLVLGAAVMAAIHSAAAIGSAAGGQHLLEVAARPVVLIFLPALLGAAILDWLWCRYSYTAGARMTEQEKRREAQETGTSPVTQHRRTTRFRERAS